MFRELICIDRSKYYVINSNFILDIILTSIRIQIIDDNSQFQSHDVHAIWRHFH